jgi:outer membrane lipoprotein-sorting protein
MLARQCLQMLRCRENQPEGIIMKHFCQRVTITVVGLCAIGLGAFAVHAEELKTTQEVLDFSSAKMATYKSWTADYLQNLSMPGGEMKISGQVLQKPPHKVRMQLEMPSMGGKSTMTMILGDDGVMWQIMQIGPKLQIMKSDMNIVLKDTATLTGGKFNPFDQINPSKQWDASKDMYDFKVVAAGEIDGQRMYVLEGLSKPGPYTSPPKAAEAAKLGKMRASIGQEDGFVHRMDLYDKSLTNVVTSMQFKNLKLNVDLPDSTFVYKPPAGEEVSDMTKMFEMQVLANWETNTPSASELAPSAPKVK